MTLARFPSSCPKCGFRPPLRLMPWVKATLSGEDPDKVVMTVRCQRKSCGEIYVITVRDFMEAA